MTRDSTTRVLLTGGSGFLGAWVVRRLLATGVQVRIFDMRRDDRAARAIIDEQADGLEWRIGDVSKAGDVAAAMEGCDGVIHLAGILTPACQADPVRGAEINLIGTLRVFEAAKRHGLGRVVYASSAGVFGPTDGDTPRPLTHYGAFKLAAEGCARAYWQDARIASVGFRPYIVYGPAREEHGSSAGPTLACRAAAWGEAYVIPFTGTTGLVYVDDVAAAFVAALYATTEGAQVFNLPGEAASTEQIIAEIRRHLPEARLSTSGPALPIAAEIPEGQLRTVFPDLPRTTLAAGVRQTIDFYRAHRRQRG